MKKLKNLSVNLTKKWLPLALAIDEKEFVKDVHE